VAEALEAVVHGDRDSCRCVGRKIEKIDLPKALQSPRSLRGDKVVMAHHDTVVQAEDHVHRLSSRTKRPCPGWEKLFESASTSSEPDRRGAMRRPFPVLNVLSVLMVVFALAMLLPLGVSFMYGDAARQAHYEAVLITFVSGSDIVGAHPLQPGRTADPRRVPSCGAGVDRAARRSRRCPF